MKVRPSVKPICEKCKVIKMEPRPPPGVQRSCQAGAELEGAGEEG